MLPSKVPTAAPPTKASTAWVLVWLLAGVAVLHFAEDVLVPVALAVLLTFLLAPLVGRLERWGAPRSVAVALSSALAFALLGALVWLVGQQFLGLVADLPSYRDNLLEKLRALPGAGDIGVQQGVATVRELSDELSKPAPEPPPAAPEVAKVQLVEPPPSAGQVMRSLFGPLIGPASTAAIVVVFVIFMLQQREDLRDRIVRLLGATEMHTTLLALDDAAQRVSRYLLVQTMINAAQGVLVATGLYFIGVPEPLLWGALTVVLRFIPYLGPALAAAGPIALAIAFFPGWSGPLMVVALIATLELVNNNVIEPWLYGSSVGVSSFPLIVATVFWTWLWGAPGLFLATPLTVCLVVMGKYIPQLGFLGVLLGDEPVLAPGERFYQRLLANDADEAQDLLDEAFASRPLPEVCDEVLLPALRYTEQDHERGAIDGVRRNAILEQVRVLIDDVPAGTRDAAPDSAAAVAVGLAPPRLSVLCLPAADLADELAAELFVRVLAADGFEAETLPASTLKGEMLERVAEARPGVICISAAPPAAVIHARYLCKRLRGRFPTLPIVVGLWDAQGDLHKAADRLTTVGSDQVVRSAAAAVQALEALRRPVLQGVHADPAGQQAGAAAQA